MRLRGKAVLIVFGLVANAALLGPDALTAAFRQPNDFSQFYIGARLGQSRYDANAVFAEQTKIFSGTRPSLMPNRLPFYYALISPLSRLPYWTAVRVWMALMSLCAIAAAFIYPMKDRLGLAATWAFSPLLFGIAGGQDVALLCLILAIGLRLRAAGWPFAAGLVLSLLAIKFHLFLLLPVAFILGREFMLLRGAATGAAGIALGSFAAGGSGWVADYVNMIVRYPNPAVALMPNLHGLAVLFPHQIVFEAMFTTIAIAGVVIVALRRPKEAIIAAALGSFLVSVHAFSADIVVIAPQLYAVFITRRSIVALICLTPIPFVFTILGYGCVPAALFLAILAEEVFCPMSKNAAIAEVV